MDALERTLIVPKYRPEDEAKISAEVETKKNTHFNKFNYNYYFLSLQSDIL
jgi:hypothetical protein